MYRLVNLLVFWAASVLFIPAWALEDSKPVCAPLSNDLAIDRVWGGTAVGFAAIENNAFIYIGYYDDERWLVVSQVDKCTGKINKVRLPSQFVGWDAHNYVTMALDSSGRLHISGNMHVSPMVYARMSKPDDLNSLRELRTMVGTDEVRSTYPKFFRFADGALGFSYRSGESGDGKEIVNRFDGRTWSRWLKQPLFASANSKLTVNAYHTDYVRGSDGYFHVAWVWRDTPNVETNFHVNYAKSRDLKQWLDSSGHTLTLPLTPQNAEIVDPVPQKAGLLNNIKLGFDGQGRVVISYLKFGAQGATQLYQARREADGWRIYQSTDWTYRWELKGGGTIVSEIGFDVLSYRDGLLLQRVRQPEIGNVTLSYRPDDLKLQKVLKDYVWEQRPSVKRQAIPGAKLSLQLVMDGDSEPVAAHAISWYSMPADTRDLPRNCQPLVTDCTYSYELQLHTSSAR